MSNSVYGKIIEYVQRRINVRLVNIEIYFLKYIRRLADISHKVFDKNHAAIHKIKPVLTLSKTIYVGFTAPFLN